jgi:acetylornithine deacetylase/succinyl-diaminopimelate desuccinylase-like protein
LDSIKAVIVLDGPSTDHVTTQALASRRFELNFAGPGGHSWNDYGTPNPVHALADAIASFIQAAEGRAGAGKTLCSYSFGVIEGGITINSIPASARAKLDMRSDDSVVLDELAGLLTAAVERGLEHENRVARLGKLSAKIKELGSRPGGRLPDDSPLLRTIQAVDSVLGIRSRVNCASTDANVPLSMGLHAVAIGAGGQGGGAHTDHEWYQPDSRDLGLRRVLLLLAALLHEEIPSEPVRSPQA